ncbi:MAG: site-specific integrase [Kiritimatiellaeota bacterium]|nr:site-specific integrase [Kiritimatiellota bacterium]
MELRLRREIRQDRRLRRLKEIFREVFGEEEVAGGLLLDEAWERYRGLPELNISPGELRRRKHHWRRFVEWMHDRHPTVRYLHEVDSATALEFADWLRPRCRTGKTFNNIKVNVGCVFSALLMRAGMSRNPFRGVPNAPTTDSVEQRAFTDAEIVRILDACRGTEYFGAVLTALYTGLRYKDIAFLCWDQVTDDALRLKPSKTRRHGVEVVIPLHRRLREYLDGQPRSSRYVFPGLAEDYEKHPRKSRFSEILDRAEIDADHGRVTFHSLRHTFRTRMAAAGVPQDIAMRLGGWRDARTAERYNHDLTGLRRAIDALE